MDREDWHRGVTVDSRGTWGHDTDYVGEIRGPWTEPEMRRSLRRGTGSSRIVGRDRIVKHYPRTEYCKIEEIEPVTEGNRF